MAGLCRIMPWLSVGLCNGSLLNYIAVLCWIVWQVCIGLCNRPFWIIWQVFVGLCGNSVSDYVAGLSRIMWQVYVVLCDSSLINRSVYVHELLRVVLCYSYKQCVNEINICVAVY